MNQVIMPNEQLSRRQGLIEMLRRASRRPTNYIDPPYDCVPMNMRPGTLTEIADMLEHEDEELPENLRREPVTKVSKVLPLLALGLVAGVLGAGLTALGRISERKRDGESN